MAERIASCFQWIINSSVTLPLHVKSTSKLIKFCTWWPFQYQSGSQTSSGFSLVIRAAMTCPRGEGAVESPSKSMGESPHGCNPYITLMSLMRWSGMPIAIWITEQMCHTMTKNSFQNENEEGKKALFNFTVKINLISMIFWAIDMSKIRRIRCTNS